MKIHLQNILSSKVSFDQVLGNYFTARSQYCDVITVTSSKVSLAVGILQQYRSDEIPIAMYFLCGFVYFIE